MTREEVIAQRRLGAPRHWLIKEGRAPANVVELSHDDNGHVYMMCIGNEVEERADNEVDFICPLDLEAMLNLSAVAANTLNDELAGGLLRAGLAALPMQPPAWTHKLLKRAGLISRSWIWASSNGPISAEYACFSASTLFGHGPDAYYGLDVFVVAGDVAPIWALALLSAAASTPSTEVMRSVLGHLLHMGQPNAETCAWLDSLVRLGGELTLEDLKRLRDERAR